MGITKRAGSIIAPFIFAFTTVNAYADIKVAVAGPMSGQYSWFGEQIQLGAELAVDDINAADGVLGQQIELVVGDDACEPPQAEAAANLFVSEEVVFVNGHWCSSSTIPASIIYQANNILMIPPASTNPKVTDGAGKIIFRQSGRDDQQATVAAKYLAENWKGKKLAFLHDGTTYGKDLVDAARSQMNQLGLNETMNEEIKPGQDNYSDIVTKMQAASIDVFYLGGYSTEAALLIREARDIGYDVQMISGDALTSEEFGIVAGDAADGTLITFFPDARNNPEARDVVERFRDVGYEPEGYTLQTYAAMQAWSQAAEKAGTLELGKMIETLHKEEFETIIGDYRFNSNGDIDAPGFVWYVFEGDTYVPV
jgi:branched-chain amino acid transport system substrate-binding protein